MNLHNSKVSYMECMSIDLVTFFYSLPQFPQWGGGGCGAALEGGASRLISQAGDNFLANIREKTNVRTHDSLCKRILKQKRQD